MSLLELFITNRSHDSHISILYVPDVVTIPIMSPLWHKEVYAERPYPSKQSLYHIVSPAYFIFFPSTVQNIICMSLIKE